MHGGSDTHCPQKQDPVVTHGHHKLTDIVSINPHQTGLALVDIVALTATVFALTVRPIPRLYPLLWQPLILLSYFFNPYLDQGTRSSYHHLDDLVLRAILCVLPMKPSSLLIPLGRGLMTGSCTDSRLMILPWASSFLRRMAILRDILERQQ